jgi:hypothetical protein
VVDVIAGSQVMFQAEASSLAAAQISYPTPSNALDTPLPTPTPLAPITAATVARDAQTWLTPLRFTITSASSPPSTASAISTSGQNRRSTTPVIFAVARAIDDPACTQAPIDGDADTDGSAMSTEYQTQPCTRSASSTMSPLADQASAPGAVKLAAFTSSQSAQLSRDWLTTAAADAGSCEPAPLRSVLVAASWLRENSPTSALGLLAGDPWVPGSGLRGSHVRSLSARPSW